MSENRSDIPDITLETLCRTFFKEAARYGFQQVDYIRFVNLLLDLATNGDNGIVPDAPAKVVADSEVSRSDTANGSALPLRGDRVDIRAFDAETDLEHWRAGYTMLMVDIFCFREPSLVTSTSTT